MRNQRLKTIKLRLRTPIRIGNSRNGLVDYVTAYFQEKKGKYYGIMTIVLLLNKTKTNEYSTKSIKNSRPKVFSLV